MDKTIQAAGLRCPQPIIETKKALDAMEEGVVTTIVDNPDAVENLMVFSRNSGYTANHTKIEDLYHVTIEKRKLSACELAVNSKSLVILIASNVFGQGSDELGENLMKSYIYALTEVEPKPQTLIFMNKGVIFTTEISEVKDSIKQLEEAGVEIISCGTCLSYYGLSEQLIAGKVSNMYTISEKMNQAERVIRI